MNDSNRLQSKTEISAEFPFESKFIEVKGSPKHTHDIIASYHEWLKETELPKICFYASPGMLIPQHEVAWLAEHFPNITMVDIGKGLHFVQEDNPHTIGAELAKWYKQI